MDAVELLALYEAGERDFQGVNLSDTDLSSSNLSKSDLSDADLSDADLSGANLTGVDLSGADLSDANLTGVDLSGADLSDANLTGVNLSNANLTGANLNGADLSNTDLSNSYLSDADLGNTDLSNADLSNTDLSNADLSNANLSNADLSGAKLNRVNLKDIIINSYTKLDEKWYFVWQIMNGQLESLKQKSYYQLCLFDSDSFDHNNYVGRDLSNSCLRNMDLTGLNLSFTMLYHADCTNANFTDTNLYCTNFHRADLRGVNFTNADLRYAILIESNLEGADFTNADLRYINLHGVDLTKSKKEGAKFTMFDDISCSWNQLNSDQFEELCYDILREKHKLTDIQKIGNSHSRDGGRDIVFYKGVDINKKPIKWIVQCKLKSDKRSLGKSQVPDISDMLEAQKAKGFCIMTSGIIDASLHDTLDALRDRKGWEVERWSYLELERFLAEHPEIKARHFKD